MLANLGFESWTPHNVVQALKELASIDFTLGYVIIGTVCLYFIIKAWRCPKG